jgi:putative transposase
LTNHRCRCGQTGTWPVAASVVCEGYCNKLVTATNQVDYFHAALPAASVDAMTYRIDGSMRSFFALHKNGHADVRPPRAIARHKFTSVPYWASSGCKLIPESDGVARLRVWGVDDLIRVHQHRPIPDEWTIQQYVVMRKSNGQWFVNCQIRNQDFIPCPTEGDAIGIDVGMYSLLALSDGTMYENPRWYRNDLKRRQRLGREADRRRRASNPGNYNEDGTVKENAVIWRKSNRLRETEQQVRRMDEKATRQRKHFYHQVTDELTKTYRLIAIEDISPQFMIHNKHLAMSAYDAAWSTFFQMLEYKCVMRGVELVKVNPRNTSQVCSGCGEIVTKPLSQRVHRCVSCGLEIDRDVNAARNILQLAINGVVQPPRDETQAVGSNVSRKVQNEYPVATYGTQ